MVNLWYFEVLVLSAEEFHGQQCWSCESDAWSGSAAPQVPWLLLPCSAGHSGSRAEVLHSSEPRCLSPSERGRNVLLGTEEPPYFLLLQLASFSWPARSCFAFSLSFCSWPQSSAQPHFFVLLCVPAHFCSVITALILAPLSGAPRASFSPLGSDVPFLPCLPWLFGAEADDGIQPSPTRSPFPGSDLQTAFVTIVGLSDLDCKSLVAVACSPLCIVRH